MKKWFWFYKKLSKKLWFRATFYCLLGVLTSVIGIVFGKYIPEELPGKVGADAVGTILNIIATSMLAVTTFSLTTMVSATAAASSSTTPRVTKLLVEDTTAQRALSTFLGSFLFSLVGIIALQTGLYGEGGRLILLASTLVVITFIVVTLLRWINHLSLLGRVGQTIDRVEDAVTDAMQDYASNPLFGAKLLTEVPPEAQAIYADTIGFVEHLNMSALSNIAEQHELHIYITMRPGRFTTPAKPMAFILPEPKTIDEQNDQDEQDGQDNQNDTQQNQQNQSSQQDQIFDEEEREEIFNRIQKAFTIADARSFEQDPRFGLIVLCEIAQRALSPAVNDPGTAIDVIGTLVRVLAVTAQAIKRDEEKAAQKVKHPRISMPSLNVKDFIEDAFMPITRDGAGMLEVSIKLQKACAAMAEFNEEYRVASYELARLSLRRSLEAMTFEPDRERLKTEAVVQEIEGVIQDTGDL